VRTIRQTLAIARREAAAYLASPIAYVVGVLFLVVEGFSFYAVLRALADPRRPAPYGAVLRAHFGGTFLYWAFLFFVVSAISMRLVAEERRTQTWESLRTAPVAEAAIVCGKWLGALAFYAALWIPTVAYVFILRAYAPPGAAPDPGPIATAYLGVFLSGAAFLALGLVASALTTNQIVASVVTFVALMTLLLAGLLPELAPESFGHAPLVDLRKLMDDFARGIVDARDVVFFASIAIAALAIATIAIGWPRRRRAEKPQAIVGAALIVVAAILANVEIARHPGRLDATRAKVYTLDARTDGILDDVRRPVHVLVLSAREPDFAQLYDEVDAVLARFAARQPLISVEKLDPALDPGRIGELAEEYALQPEEVSGGGVVIFLAGERKRAVGLLDMADFATGAGGGVLREFRGEEAFAAALLEVTDEERPELCLTTGHGEIPLAADPDRQEASDLSLLAAALAKDGVQASELGGLEAGVPARCALVAIMGPRAPFRPAEARALDGWLDRGGRLLVAVDPIVDAGAIAATGLEGVLERMGARLRPGIVVDPGREVGIPLGWATLSGYGKHPIGAAFQGRRPTVWIEPRWVDVLDAPGTSAEPIVSSSADGWAETDVGSLVRGRAPAQGSGDAPGPVPVGVAATRGDARLVLFGSARSFASANLDRKLGANDALARSAVAWLGGRTKLVGVGPKTPEQLRVVLTADQERRLFVVSVAGLPLAFALAGGLWQLRRRRRRRG
jgi:ABC-2 type transport system permease protein